MLPPRAVVVSLLDDGGMILTGMPLCLRDTSCAGIGDWNRARWGYDARREVSMSYRDGSDAARSPLVVAFNGRVFGMDPATGERIWQFVAGGSKVSLAIHDDRVFAAGLGIGGIVCLDYRTGKEIWRVASGIVEGVLVHDGRVFLGLNGAVECFTMEGKRIWVDEFAGHGHGIVALGFADHVVQADS